MVIAHAISRAFVGTYVEVDGLTCIPIAYNDLEEMVSWPKFEEKRLAWANFPAQTSELRKRWYLQQQKDHLQWLIIRDQEGELIGRCSLTQPLSGKSIIFGLVIRPDKLGQGLGTRITRIMVSYTFSVTDNQEVEDIWLESRYDNIIAQKTWERVGFIREGEHMRREIFGRYDRYIGYRLRRSQLEKLELPDVEVMHLA